MWLYEQDLVLRQLGCSSSRQMNKGNASCAKEEEHPLRITRARARALGGIPPYSRPSFKNDHKKASSKRAASVNKACAVVPDARQQKRKAVLTDVTNISKKPHDMCIQAPKFQVSMKN